MMHWIVEITRTSVKVFNTENRYETYHEIKPGWQAAVDKMDDIFLVNLKDSAGHTIHLAMLPKQMTSVVLKNISDIYKQIESSK